MSPVTANQVRNTKPWEPEQLHTARQLVDTGLIAGPSSSSGPPSCSWRQGASHASSLSKLVWNRGRHTHTPHGDGGCGLPSKVMTFLLQPDA